MVITAVTTAFTPPRRQIRSLHNHTVGHWRPLVLVLVTTVAYETAYVHAPRGDQSRHLCDAQPELDDLPCVHVRRST
jgi:hypothetical protein